MNLPSLDDIDMSISKPSIALANGVAVAAASHPKIQQLPAGNPYAQAAAYIETRHTIDGARTVIFWNGIVYRWTGAYWEPLTDDAVRADIATFLLDQVELVTPIHKVRDDGKSGPSKSRVALTQKHVVELFAALKNRIYHSDDSLKPPQWLDETPMSSSVIAVVNGLLDLTTGELRKPSPLYLNLNALDVAYDPEEQYPRWLKFLGEVFPTNPGAKALLQQIFGYIISSDTKLQKLIEIVGPPRSGKGTIARVAKAMMGARSCASPTIGTLTKGTFGYQSLIGKRLIVIPDARLSNKQDVASALEMLLALTGGDNPNIPRKFLSDYSGPSEFKIMMLSNELVDFGSDVSGAMANRVVPIECRESFLGHEDLDLFERDLLPELPGILNWAIEGWLTLQAAGRFELDDDARDLINQLEGIHSGDFGEFKEAVLIKDAPGDKHPGSLLDKNAVFIEYRKWCEENKRRAKDKPHFYRDVKAAGIDATFRWDEETRTSYRRDKTRPTPRLRGYSINRNYTTEGD